MAFHSTRSTTARLRQLSFAAAVGALASCGDDAPVFFPGFDVIPDATDVRADTPDTEPDAGSDTGSDAESDTASDATDDTHADTIEDSAPDTAPTGGCGRPPAHASGGAQVMLDVGPDGDGERGFYLSIPRDYDPATRHALYVGYPGTNWVGEQVRGYLALEDGTRNDEIFVYLDPLWRDFEGWGNLGGWVLGPYAHPADGMGDLVFTEAVLDYLDEHYCIDEGRVFATGHSWGGDMTAVVACFLGNRFTAVAPAAANRPYWFEPDGIGGAWAECRGEPSVWTWFGVADDHFTWQEYGGEFGDQQRDFWLQSRDCEGPDAYDVLDISGAEGACVAFHGCAADTRYCLYGPESRHQIPSYFSEAVRAYFRSF